MTRRFLAVIHQTKSLRIEVFATGCEPLLEKWGYQQSRPPHHNRSQNPIQVHFILIIRILSRAGYLGR